MRFTFAAKSLLEVSSNREVNGFLLNHSNRVRNQTLIVLAKKPNDVQHSAQRPCGIGSSTKTEDIERVQAARPVLSREERRSGSAAFCSALPPFSGCPRR